MESPQKMNDTEFKIARDLVYRATGIHMDDSKRVLLSNRIRRRLRVLKHDNFSSYLRFVRSAEGSDERDNFVNVVTTNETFFFRTPKQFKWFEEEFLADCYRQSMCGERSEVLKLWSAACSSGEEAYSLAISLLKKTNIVRKWNVTITGTDISQRILDQARQGIFKPRAIELVEPALQRRYFTKKDDSHWELKSSVKDLVEFRHHNLLVPMTGGPFDCVFLRNVLIYFDDKSKRSVLENVTKVVANGGYLLLGPSEGIWGSIEGFEKRKPWLYQKTS